MAIALTAGSARRSRFGGGREAGSDGVEQEVMEGWKLQERVGEGGREVRRKEGELQ